MKKTVASRKLLDAAWAEYVSRISDLHITGHFWMRLRQRFNIGLDTGMKRSMIIELLSKGRPLAKTFIPQTADVGVVVTLPNGKRAHFAINMRTNSLRTVYLHLKKNIKNKQQGHLFSKSRRLKPAPPHRRTPWEMKVFIIRPS